MILNVRRHALLTFGLLSMLGGAHAQTSQAQAQAQPRPAAAGAQKPASAAKPKPEAPSGSAQSAPAGVQGPPVATFGDWNVYATQQGRSRICYAIAQPAQRLPKNLSRDPAYFFVSARPAENVENEIALIMGFPMKEAAAPQVASAAPGRASDAKPVAAAPKEESLISVGRGTYAIVGKGKSAWLLNPAQERQAVDTMAQTAVGRQARLTVKAVSARGNVLTDEYSLTGFNEAIQRLREECKPARR